MQKIHFVHGEDRHVRLAIHATNGEPFLIREASFELKCAGETENTGECAIDGSIIDARISPEKKATYLLLMTYHVADETLVEKIEVVVT